MSIRLKLKKYTAKEIAEITGGRLEEYNGGENGPQNAVAIDSRDTGDGIIFSAIIGERANGNDFIPSAIENGSRVFICRNVPDEAKNRTEPFSAVIVEDTVKSL